MRIGFAALGFAGHQVLFESSDKGLIKLGIFDHAAKWVTRQQEIILESGVSLTSEQIVIASHVGVLRPEKIRILSVVRISPPDDPLLRKVAEEMNFLGPDTIGLTLGYGIYLREGYITDRLLSHEFRHVQQYEVAGSIRAFAAEYIQQIFQYGYYDAPYEVDARAHEIIH